MSTDGTKVQPIIRKKAPSFATINTNRYDNQKRVRERKGYYRCEGTRVRSWSKRREKNVALQETPRKMCLGGKEDARGAVFSPAIRL